MILIKLVTINELDRMDEIKKSAVSFMQSLKIDQWDENYPTRMHFHDDIMNKVLYGYYDDGILLGAVVLMDENDPPYEELSNWTDDVSFVIHRLIVDPNAQGRGIGKKLVNYAHELAREKGYKSMKVDTHLENYVMRNLLEKNGYYEVGYLKSINRIAYEKIL